MTDTYFAGFFDGEGSVGLDRGRYLRAQTVNTDRRIPEAMRERFGGSCYLRRRKKESTHRPTWSHDIRGRAAYEMLVVLRPYLVVKAERVDEVLVLLGGLPELPPRERTRCRHGHLYDEQNTHIRPNGSRRCRICDRDRHRRARELRS